MSLYGHVIDWWWPIEFNWFKTHKNDAKTNRNCQSIRMFGIFNQFQSLNDDASTPSHTHSCLCSLSVWTGGMKNQWFVAVLTTYETLLKFNIKKTCDVPQKVRCGRFRSIDNMYIVRKVRKVDKHNNKPNETYEIRYTHSHSHTHRHGTECRAYESATDTHSICGEKERQIIIIAMKCN